MLEIVVHEIRGYCPVYKVGDKKHFFFLEKRKPVLKEKTKKSLFGKLINNLVGICEICG